VDIGAWCSPGCWRNAEDAAWTLAGAAKTDLFSATVVPDFHATSRVERIQTVWRIGAAEGIGARRGQDLDQRRIRQRRIENETGNLAGG
jgi:hypothetical protein